MDVFFERSDRSSGNDHHTAGEIVRPCGLCQQSNMVLRRNRDGNFMVGCVAFPQCRNAIWLPGPVLEATLTTNICPYCTPGPVYLIEFKFRQLEIPPGFNVDHLGCIGGCDETLRQLVEICGTGSRAQARGRTPNTTSNNVQQSNSRRGTCTHCQQTGHSSSDCTSQRPSSRRAQPHGINQQNDVGESSMACGTCGALCVLRTANTANNRGRKFYSCPSNGCNFFVWEDSLSNSNNERNGGRPNNSSANRGRRVQNGGRGADRTFVSATGDPISDRRCYRCGDPSHFANVCPHRGSS